MQSRAEIENEQCSLCQGSGWELVAGRGVRECDCARRRRIDKALSNARIPERFREASFENYDAATLPLQRAVMMSRAFVSEMPATDFGLLYQGSCGIGKTHLSCACLTSLIQKGLTGFFYEFGDLLTTIRDSYNANTKASEMQVLVPVLTADVLVLDELGAAKPTDWVQETVTRIVNERYNAKRITIFTSNYPDVAAGPYDETLTDRVGVRLRSRLHEMCRLVPMEGEDYRLKIRNRKVISMA